jgi:hypothetical protein
MSETNLPKRWKKNKNLNPEQEEQFRQLYNEAEFHDAIRGIMKSVFMGVIDLNIRLAQYKQQFNSSTEVLVVQTLADFKNERSFSVLQVLDAKKIYFDKPVAMFNGRLIFFDDRFKQFQEDKT